MIRAAVFLDLFSRDPSTYAAARPSYPSALFARLAALAPGTARAWDCATGNGQAALGLALHFDRVDATDASAAQIEHALPHERVCYAVAAAEASGLPDSSIDVISVATALHWFDRPRFYQEARRVLKPRGVLAVYGYCWFYVSPEIDAVVDECLLQPIVERWAPQNELAWSGYRTIEFPFAEITPPRLAIHRHWNLTQLIDFYLTWSAPQLQLTSEGEAFLVRGRRRLQEVWGDAALARAVVIPLHLRFGRMP
jgi:SAM-dependent methyltransferase